MDGKICISTIAKMAQTSTASVSHYINWSETIPLSEEKRQRIMEAMRSTNFRPNAASSLLGRKKTLPGTVVFLYGNYVSAHPFEVCKSPKVSEMLTLLACKVKKNLGLTLEARQVEDESNKDSWCQAIADAEAVICYERLDRMLFELTKRRNIPLIHISESSTLQVRGGDIPSSEVDYLYWDASGFVNALIQHLFHKGGTRFAYVSSWNIHNQNPGGENAAAEEKITSFMQVMKKQGLQGEVLVPPRPEITAESYEAKNAYEYLRPMKLAAFDAIIAHNDYVALGAAWALGEQGRKIGTEILLCGEGDYVECRHVPLSLTTITCDKTRLVNELCIVLADRLQNNVPQGLRIKLPDILIERQSTQGITLCSTPKEK